MIKRILKFIVAKFTFKLLNSVDLYKNLNENNEKLNYQIHQIHQVLDQKIHTALLEIQKAQLRLDNLPQDILKLKFNELRLNSDAIIYADKLRSILTLHHPANRRYTRKGDDRDGGYVIVDDLAMNDTLLSIGIGDNISFDIGCESQVSKIVLVDGSVPNFEVPNSKYFLLRKKLAANENHSDITIDQLLNTFPSEEYILKIDIEGDEWEVVSSLLPTTMTKFRQIIIEFHDLINLAKSELILSALINLSRTHFPIIAHPNNIGGYRIIGSDIFPNVLETTWLRRDTYDLLQGFDFSILPYEKINDPNKSDIWVDWIYRS
jgi:hypothetical protein